MSWYLLELLSWETTSYFGATFVALQTVSFILN